MRFFFFLKKKKKKKRKKTRNDKIIFLYESRNKDVENSIGGSKVVSFHDCASYVKGKERINSIALIEKH
jgi:hypothetical protein